jgi:hypothetical protein
MSTKKVIQDFGRQFPLTAVQKIVFGDTLDDSINALTIELPENALMLDGYLTTTTVFNSTTADVLTIGDGTDVDYYLAAGNLQSAVRKQFTTAALAKLTTDANKSLVLTWSGATGDATTGEAYVVVEYVVVGRANENQD